MIHLSHKQRNSNKILFSDLDGTLLYNKGNHSDPVTDENLEAIACRVHHMKSENMLLSLKKALQNALNT